MERMVTQNGPLKSWALNQLPLLMYLPQGPIAHEPSLGREQSSEAATIQSYI